MRLDFLGLAMLKSLTVRIIFRTQGNTQNMDTMNRKYPKISSQCQTHMIDNARSTIYIRILISKMIEYEKSRAIVYWFLSLDSGYSCSQVSSSHMAYESIWWQFTLLFPSYYISIIIFFIFFFYSFTRGFKLVYWTFFFSVTLWWQL